MLGHVDGPRPGAPSNGAPSDDGVASTLLDDRYRLDGVVGRGAVGAVYRALDVLLDREVAVKVLPAVHEDTDELLRNRAEIRMLASLDNPGLVTLFDAGAVDHPDGSQQVYLVMELVDGPTLAERLRRGHLDAAQTALVGREIATALVDVHDRGIIHRDIKPANLLLTSPDALDGPDRRGLPTVKLADFGIARLAGASRLTMTGVTLGTVRYLSPEQATGAALEPASDVYSLGLVLLECATGRPAFSGTTAEVALARLVAPPQVPADLGQELGGLLSWMTRMAPEDRPSTQEVAAGFAALVGTGGTLVLPALDAHPATRPTARTRPEGWSRARSARVLGAVAAVALVTLGVLLVGQHLSGPAAEPAPPAYPTVQGPLGTSLAHLQQSVQP